VTRKTLPRSPSSVTCRSPSPSPWSWSCPGRPSRSRPP
jgi:hypothetical protein